MSRDLCKKTDGCKGPICMLDNGHDGKCVSGYKGSRVGSEPTTELESLRKLKLKVDAWCDGVIDDNDLIGFMHRHEMVSDDVSDPAVVAADEIFSGTCRWTRERLTASFHDLIVNVVHHAYMDDMNELAGLRAARDYKEGLKKQKS